MGELADKRILLVEDEAIIALSQARILESQGCAVLVAPSGQAAVDLAAQDPLVDMVLMDINLGPGMDGIEAARRILARRDLPLIFLSSHTEKDVVEGTEAITNYGYILKSAGETVLLASMKMALRLFKATALVKLQSRDLEAANRELEARSAALGFSEKLFRTTFYSIGDAVAATDTAGRVTRLNAEAERLCGWTEAEARSRPHAEVLRFLHEGSRSPVPSPVDKVLAEGGTVGLANHTILLSRDGEERPITDSAAPILDSAGGLHGVVLVFRDQSEARKAQRALEESEGHFRSVFELASVGIVQVEPREGRILDCNRTYCEILGYAREELLSMRFPELTWEGDRAADWKVFRAAAEGHGVYTNEKRYVRKDGSLIWVRLNAAFIRDPEGRVVQTIAVAEDISGRKEAERLRDEAFRHYEHAFDELLEGCQILDRDLRYVYVNRTAARHGQTEVDRLIGRTILEVYPGTEGSELHRRLLAGLDSPRPIQFENHFRYPDGSEGWFSISLRKVPEGVLILSIDVTESVLARKGAERHAAELEASRQEARLLADIVESSSQPIGMGFPDGSLGFVNRAFCELVGYSQEELASIAWSRDLTPPEWLEPEARILEELSRTGRPVRYRKEYLRKDGKRVPIELLCHIVAGVDGKPTHYFSFIEDISERLGSQERLEASVRERELLYLELQHRVKNSLLLISSVVDLEAMSTKDEGVRTSLRSVRGRIEVLSRLYQLLGQDSRTEVDLSSYIRLVCDSLASTYGRPGVGIGLELEPITLDLKRATSLGLILNELVTNSLKHAFPGESGGRVEVALSRVGAEVRLRVSDDGQGLPPGYEPGASQGLGFRLIQELSRQLGARLETGTGRGSSRGLSFPLGF